MRYTLIEYIGHTSRCILGPSSQFGHASTSSGLTFILSSLFVPAPASSNSQSPLSSPCHRSLLIGIQACIGHSWVAVGGWWLGAVRVLQARSSFVHNQPPESAHIQLIIAMCHKTCNPSNTQESSHMRTFCSPFIISQRMPRTHGCLKCFSSCEPPRPNLQLNLTASVFAIRQGLEELLRENCLGSSLK